MRYRELGRTGLQVSEIGLGAEWLERHNQEEVTAVIQRCESYGINILDISQTLLQDYFTMVMLVDVGQMSIPFPDVKEALSDLGEKLALSIRIQHEDIFRSMHQL